MAEAGAGVAVVEDKGVDTLANAYNCTSPGVRQHVRLQL